MKRDMVDASSHAFNLKNKGLNRFDKLVWKAVEIDLQNLSHRGIRKAIGREMPDYIRVECGVVF